MDHPAALNFERHRQLYLDDGDVVLQAPISAKAHQGGFQLFCVHKAVLRAHSVVFSNLFADASASPDVLAGLTYDGRPLVNMPDDATDLSHLLTYLYDPSHYLLRSSHPDTALELTGAAKLADKYVLTTVRAAMIKRVVMDWPTTLDGWDMRKDELQAMQGRLERREIAQRTLEPVSAIIFAQECGCPEILGAAFYCLSTIGITSDWDGSKNFWGRFPRGSGARWALCSKENLLRYMLGREALARFHHSVRVRIWNGVPLSDRCAPNEPHFVPEEQGDDYPAFQAVVPPCLHYIRSLCNMIWGQAPIWDPLQGLRSMLDHASMEALAELCPAGLCNPCQVQFESWVTEERKDLWSGLEEAFKLQ